MDEKLKKTIDNIILLAEQNPEFDAEMRKHFGGPLDSQNISHSSSIVRIEKYLGLDYYVDSQPSSIDYSYIKQPEVKAQLVSDYREMMRFRYGTRYHKIIFPEFCRYAQLQGEMLLNYFYTTVEAGNISKIKEHISKYDPAAKFGKETNEVFKISFSVKKWAFDNEFSLSSNYVWNNIILVRNSVSHRSPHSADKNFVKDYYERMKEQGYIIKTDGNLSNWDKLDEAHRNIYNNFIRKNEENKRYTFEAWLSNEPYETVFEAVKELNEKVKQNLN